MSPFDILVKCAYSLLKFPFETKTEGFFFNRDFIRN